MRVGHRARAWVSGVMNREFERYACRWSQGESEFSSERDLAATCVHWRNRGFDISLLSLRTTGCRATIVMFVEDGHKFSPDVEKVIAITRTEVRYCRWPNVTRKWHKSRDFVRAVWLRDFLDADMGRFDRLFALMRSMCTSGRTRKGFGQ
jgi:hypothetical protein